MIGIWPRRAGLLLAAAGLARLPSELIMRSSMGVLGAAGYIAIGAMHIARCGCAAYIGRSGSRGRRSAGGGNELCVRRLTQRHAGIRSESDINICMAEDEEAK